MPRTLISLISEQTAPNLLLILDPAFAEIDHYLFLSTPKMNVLNQFQHLLAAAALNEEQIAKITVSAHDPRSIYESLEAQCSPEGQTYWINLTGGTKMMSLAVWAYFSRPAFVSEFFYVSLGENTYRRIFPLERAELLPLNYRFSLQTYLTAYGITEQENPMSYYRNPAVERLLFEGSLVACKPLLTVNKEIWWFANHLNYLYLNFNGKRKPPPAAIPISIEPWTQDYFRYLNYSLVDPQEISGDEIRYLSSGWFEHYVHDAILNELKLPLEAIASQIKLYRRGEDWKYANHEFDVIFLYRNRLYVVECKTAIRRNKSETKRLFDQALYRLAAVKRDFGLNVSVSLVLLTDQLRKNKHIEPRYTRRADLFDVPIIDQHLLAQGAKAWVPLVVGEFV